MHCQSSYVLCRCYDQTVQMTKPFSRLCNIPLKLTLLLMIVIMKDMFSSLPRYQWQSTFSTGLTVNPLIATGLHGRCYTSLLFLICIWAHLSLPNRILITRENVVTASIHLFSF